MYGPIMSKSASNSTYTSAANILIYLSQFISAICLNLRTQIESNKMRSFNDLKKNLKKDYSGFKTIKIALLADSASQFLVSAIKGYGYERELNFEI